MIGSRAAAVYTKPLTTRAQRCVGLPRSVTVTSTVSGTSGLASVCRGVETTMIVFEMVTIVAGVPPKSTRMSETVEPKPLPVRVTVVPPSGGPLFGVRLAMKKVGSVLQIPPDPLPRYVKACGSVAAFSATRPMSRRQEKWQVSEMAGFASACRGVVTVICWSCCATIVADAPQNVTSVVAMFVPKWPPKTWTVSPPAGEPAVGLIDERKSFSSGGMHAKVNWNGGDVNLFTTTTTSTVSGTAGFFSG